MQIREEPTMQLGFCLLSPPEPPRWRLSQAEPPPAPRSPSEHAYRFDISPNLSPLLAVENVSLLRANDTDAEEREE